MEDDSSDEAEVDLSVAAQIARLQADMEVLKASQLAKEKGKGKGKAVEERTSARKSAKRKAEDDDEVVEVEAPAGHTRGGEETQDGQLRHAKVEALEVG